MKTLKPLTAREAAFVREYLLHGKQSEAYTNAGYSPKSARANAARMMEKESVMAAIDEGLLLARKRNQVTVDRNLAELGHIAFTGMSRFVKIDPDGQPCMDISCATPRDLDLLSELTIETFADGKGQEARKVRRVKIKLYDRLHALEILGRHLGMFKEGNGGDVLDPLQQLLAEIQERGSAIPVRPQGPLGSPKVPRKD